MYSHTLIHTHANISTAQSAFMPPYPRDCSSLHHHQCMRSCITPSQTQRSSGDGRRWRPSGIIRTVTRSIRMEEACPLHTPAGWGGPKLNELLTIKSVLSQNRRGSDGEVPPRSPSGSWSRHIDILSAYSMVPPPLPPPAPNSRRWRESAHPPH